ncbi:hypothetical protein ACIBAH_34380 [Streptomyces sp. NPDC051445]|uniref:hypothetical protein n=1 Tax=Streptomyces sp. NPDC051445 TaxID=3365653 RepID=UPI0037B0A635
MRKNTKFLTLGAATFALTIGGWFSYQHFFTDGLEKLPAKVCNESIKRETVIRILPQTRSAEEGADINGVGASFMFSCHIYTAGDSILSGEAQIQDSSQDAWESYYKSYGGKSKGPSKQASSGGIHALSRGDFASVYVPCVPSGGKAEDASQAYALISEVRVIGDSRAAGLDLHQALTDFAYELTQRAYVLGKCVNAQRFPTELPRFKER